MLDLLIGSLKRCFKDLLLPLPLSFLEVHLGAFLGVNSEAPCNVLPDAPDEALEMNVEFDEVEPSIELLEIS